MIYSKILFSICPKKFSRSGNFLLVASPILFLVMSVSDTVVRLALPVTLTLIVITTSGSFLSLVIWSSVLLGCCVSDLLLSIPDLFRSRRVSGFFCRDPATLAYRRQVRAQKPEKYSSTTYPFRHRRV